MNLTNIPQAPMAPVYGKKGGAWTEYEIWIFKNWPRLKAINEICGEGKRTPKAFRDREYQTRVQENVVGVKFTKEEILRRGTINSAISKIDGELETIEKSYNSLLRVAQHKLGKIVEMKSEKEKLMNELNNMSVKPKTFWKN